MNKACTVPRGNHRNAATDTKYGHQRAPRVLSTCPNSNPIGKQKPPTLGPCHKKHKLCICNHYSVEENGGLIVKQIA